ncbi:MAG: ECF-type sigma factor, partial [Acidobacteriota bacterium]
MPTSSIDLQCPPGAGRPSGDITRQLRSWQRGDGRALDLLTPQILHELRRVARSVLGGARDRTLGVTALVHEGYLRLAHRSGVQWSCRGEVFAYMATTMRRIVLNHVRDGQAAKRGGGAV